MLDELGKCQTSLAGTAYYWDAQLRQWKKQLGLRQTDPDTDKGIRPQHVLSIDSATSSNVSLASPNTSVPLTPDPKKHKDNHLVQLHTSKI